VVETPNAATIPSSLPTLLAWVVAPTLRERLTADAGAFDLRWLPTQFATPREAVVTIADAQGALLVVETDEASVVAWLSLVRSDPATRRLPLVALATTDAGEALATSVRADAIVTPALLTTSLAQILRDHAQAPADADALRDQCAAPLPELVRKGLHEFNTGEYYECHETLEQAWMAEVGPVRDVYRAILQIGVAYYQIVRGNYRGAHKMFVRAVQWIGALPDRCHGIDIAGLRADAMAARAHLEALGEANIAQFDRAMLKPINMDGSHE
jgi:hypothetical protein